MAPIFCVLVALAALCLPASAEQILYQSATLGQTGITPQQLLDQEVPGTNINSNVFIGARFKLTNHVLVSRIGGHFGVGFSTSGSFFGALVSLIDESDVPDTNDLSSSDVLGHTLIEFPDPSDEAYGDLEAELSPGWYGVVYGSGLFGATAAGGAVRNNIDQPNLSLFSRQTGLPWASLPPLVATGHRFTVLGVVVPEPATISILLCAMTVVYCRRRRDR